MLTRSPLFLLPLGLLAALLACPGGGLLDDDDVTPPGDDDTLLDDDDVTPATDDDDSVADADATAPPCDDDGLEENDYTASATALVPGEPVPAISCLGDDDWFVVELEGGSSLEVVVDFINDDGDIDVELIDLDTGEIADSTSTGDQESVSGAVAVARSLYVRVFLYGDDDAGGGSAYTITATVGACPTDPFEPNDTQDSAAALTAGEHDGLLVCLDDDWYSIELTAGASLSVGVLFPNTEGDVDAKLYDGSGEVLLESVSTDDDEAIGPWEATADGPVYLRIYLYADQGESYGNTYQLQVTVE